MDILPEFAGIDLNELELISIETTRFYLPTAEQYLKIYQNSYKDSYRANNNNLKNLKKIEYLQENKKIES